MKTALVTGSAGFVGRHLCPKLEWAGYNIDKVDPLEKVNPRRFELDYVNGVRHDVVVHLAANIDSLDKRVSGGAEQFSDCLLDLAMMRYIENFPPKIYVHMTSCVASYPTHNDPYCAVKIFSETMAQHVCKRSGIRLVLLRPYSGYGTDQSLSYPFPAIIDRATRRQNPLVVWGSQHTVRDFIHVDDLVRAIYYGIIGKFPDGVPIELGSGIGTSMGELARMAADEVGYSPEIVTDTTKPAGARRRVADTSIAKSCGFDISISLKKGIHDAVLGSQNL